MYILFTLFFLLFQSEDIIEIEDPWMRPSSKNMATALYFTIENNSEFADTLYRVDSDIAGKVEIHETYSQDDMMGMREVGMIIIESKESFELKPGAHHIMLMKLTKDIKDGDEAEFILYFKQAGEMKITATAKKQVK
jgi:copper(I)-binding protein